MAMANIIDLARRQKRWTVAHGHGVSRPTYLRGATWKACILAETMLSARNLGCERGQAQETKRRDGMRRFRRFCRDRRLTGRNEQGADRNARRAIRADAARHPGRQ